MISKGCVFIRIRTPILVFIRLPSAGFSVHFIHGRYYSVLSMGALSINFWCKRVKHDYTRALLRCVNVIYKWKIVNIVDSMVVYVHVAYNHLLRAW